MGSAFIGIGLVFFLGHALNVFFNRTRIPDTMILIFIGYLLGPRGMSMVDVAQLGDLGRIMSTTALIVILYEGGIHLRAKELLTSSLPALALTSLGFILIALLTSTLSMVFHPDLGWTIAILLGLGVGSTSAAVVIPMVRSLSISNRCKTILSLESAFTDVIAIILFLGVLNSASASEFSMSGIIFGLSSTPFISAGLGAAAGLFWAFLRHRRNQLVNMTFGGEAYALLVYGLVESVHMNGVLAVFAMGFTLVNLNLLPPLFREWFGSETVSFKETDLLKELVFLLRVAFFLYLGLLVRFDDWATVSMAILITLGIFLTRYLAVRIVMRPKEYGRLDAVTASGMGPRGLACAVLAALPVQQGLPGGDFVQNTVFAVIPFSIFMTTVFVFVAERASLRSQLNRFFGPYAE